MAIEELANITKWDAFFVNKIKNLVEMESELRESSSLELKTLRRAKSMGFPDESIATPQETAPGACARGP